MEGYQQGQGRERMRENIQGIRSITVGTKQAGGG